MDADNRIITRWMLPWGALVRVREGQGNVEKVALFDTSQNTGVSVLGIALRIVNPQEQDRNLYPWPNKEWWGVIPKILLNESWYTVFLLAVLMGAYNSVLKSNGGRVPTNIGDAFGKHRISFFNSQPTVKE